MSWNEERVEELGRLWDLGHSASIIGKRIGVSKNAVIGKAHRLGLRPRPSPIKRRLERPVVTVPVLQEAPAEPAPKPLPPPRVVGSGPRCMWPLGEPGDEDFRFCEAPATAGKPYCSAHCDRAYITRSRTGSEAA